MSTSSRDMGNLMRTKRRALDDYMYEPPKSASSAEKADTVISELEADEPGLSTHADDVAEETAETPAITVLGPEDESDPEQYTYEKMDNGAWMVYPPGVPCEAGKSRVQMDHAATEAEYADMDAALGESGTPEPGGTADVGEDY